MTCSVHPALGSGESLKSELSGGRLDDGFPPGVVGPAGLGS